MKQNSQWLSHVRTRSNSALGHLGPERFARPLVHVDVEIDAVAVDLEADVGLVGPQPPLDDVARDPAVDAPDGVTGTEPGARRPGNRARRRRRGVTTWAAPGYRCPSLGSLEPRWVTRRPPRTSSGCCWPSRGGSAPGSRWRSRRWHGWSAASRRPCTATTRSSTTRSIVRRFEDQGVVFVDDIADVPPGSPIMLSAHGSAPSVVAAAEQRGTYVVDAVCPLVTKVHHEVRGAGREGLPHRVRRPRRPRGGRRHDGRRARRDDPRRVGRRRRGAARLRRAGRPARPDDAVAPGLGGRRRRRAATVPRRLVARSQRPVLRDHEPAVRADRARRPVRRAW